MNTKVVFILFSILLAFNVCCQNIDNQAFWEEILTADTISNLTIQESKLFQLIKQKQLSKTPNDSLYAKLFHILGRNARISNKPQLAKKYTEQAIIINKNSSKLTNKYHLGLSYYNLASIYVDQLYNYKLALQYYDSSIKFLVLSKKINRFYAKALNTKASIYFSIGDYSNTILLAEKVINDKTNFPEEVVAGYIEKIQALLETKQYKLAESNFLNSFAIAKAKMPQTEEIANLHTLWGDLKLYNKHYKQAISSYQSALLIHQKNGNNYGSGQAFLALINVYFAQKDYKTARESMDKYQNFYKYDPYLLLYAKNKKVESFFLEKKTKLALEILNKEFIAYFKNVDDFGNPYTESIKAIINKENLLSFVVLKAKINLEYYHHTNKKEYLENALETFVVADKMVDYMRREHVGYQSKLFWRDKTHSLYENAIEVCYLLKNYEKGFYFFEKSRAVLLNDKINNLSANQLLSEADQLKERNFQHQIADLNSQIESETVEAKKSILNVKMLDIQESQQKFIEGLAVKYPSYYAFKYDTKMYNLGQLKEYLKKSNTSFIEYFKGDSANYQLVIKPTGVNIIKQKPIENLYQYLINAADLGKRVIVSQDGEFVPLDTLKNAKGEILLKKYAFSNTYSAQYLLRNAEKTITNSWLNNFIGFAPVNYSKSMALPSLLGADEALNIVSKNYFWPKNYENELATKANFARKASDYKIIQLFTHADADNAHKEPIIFFADSAMKVSEFESFGHFNTELLVLSACKTNVGKVAKGEGTLSMAREFAGLGIPATITTLWAVENEATYQITELFYKYLKNGEPKDVALHKAKIEYLEINSREKQDPKFWAAFVLMGETAPLAGFDSKIVYVVGISLLILGIISIYFLSRKKVNY